MKPAGAVWLASALYASLYFVLGYDKYATYHAGADLGLFTQTIASAFSGFRNTTEGGSHFTFHFSPDLALFAPLLLAWRSPLALVAVQAAAGALVAPPLFWLARKRMPGGPALGVAIVALAYPPLAGVTFSDFHENGLAPAAVAWLVWAVDARRFAVAAALLVFVLGIKEDEALFVAAAAVFALVYFGRKGDAAGRIFAAAALAAAAAVFVSFFTIVRPLAGARMGWAPLHFYVWARAVDAGSTPWYSIGRPAYFLEALVPLAFACVFSPVFLLALPGFAECLLSHSSATYTMGTHYAGAWVGWVLVAFAFGIARVYRGRPKRALLLLRISLALCAAVLLFASPTHWGHYLRARTAHDRLLDRTLAALRPDLEFGTHDELFAHAGFDPNASLGLTRDPRFALFDRTYAQTSYWAERDLPLLDRAAAACRYKIRSSEDGVVLFEKTGKHGCWDGALRTRAGDRSGVARGGGNR